MADEKSTTPPTRYPHEALRSFAVECLEKKEVPREDAEIIANSLVTADMFGFQTHGIRRLRHEIETIGPEAHDPKAEVTVVSETPAVALMDGGNGPGPVAAHRAMMKAMEKARAVGVGLVAVRNTNSFGAASPFSSLALEEGLIGFCCANFAGTVVAPPFSTKSLIGTNPISLAVPAGKEFPFLLDMATSVVAGGKMRPYKLSGKPLPWGWAQDREGNVVTDVKKMMSLLPLGSTPELGSFKGYGLGLGVDIMTGVLVGGYYGNLKMRQGKRKEEKNTSSHLHAALDPARFRPLEEFLGAMDEMITYIHQTKPVAGATRVPVVGEREMAARAEARTSGVPLAPEIVEDLRKIGGELGVEPRGF